VAGQRCDESQNRSSSAGLRTHGKHDPRRVASAECDQALTKNALQIWWLGLQGFDGNSSTLKTNRNLSEELNMFEVAVFDTKPYDREYLAKARGSNQIDWWFHEFRLTAKTATAAKGASAVCVFVNDQLDRPCLEALAESGV
jgi:hypothetical protein